MKRINPLIIKFKILGFYLMIVNVAKLQVRTILSHAKVFNTNKKLRVVGEHG
jgi:hypothetical protein